jgi:SAM-dependent methyltransferase
MSGGCRICGAASVRQAGAVEYFEGFQCPVLDCDSCGCRFTTHDSTVHDQFQRQPALSYYSDYHVLADRCRDLAAARDLAGLERLLRDSPKYRFVIDAVSALPSSASILEFGCSRGYLTAYSILAGRRITGVDVSPDAVTAARNAFGDFFAVAGTPEATTGAPFDLIYHVGLIGCVADPLGLTRRLLATLKPGGRLIFNAPNRDALRFSNQLWIDSAPPPDLVTLFPPGFWRAQCSAFADVEESVASLDARSSFSIGAQRALGVGWHPPAPQPMSVRAHAFAQRHDGWRHLLSRAITKAAEVAGVTGGAAQRPSEFGLFVSMRPRAAA